MGATELRCNAGMATLFASLARGDAFARVASSSLSRRGRGHGPLLQQVAFGGERAFQPVAHAADLQHHAAD
ncbi:MAG TPA: hypothetical protein PLD19_10210, partial [Luteimonas sp.]|nr:hypothetical protein [Luteimonas sp.]